MTGHRKWEDIKKMRSLPPPQIGDLVVVKCRQHWHLASLWPPDEDGYIKALNMSGCLTFKQASDALVLTLRKQQ